jgi:23S rRNA pseudouridine2604 synthase
MSGSDRDPRAKQPPGDGPADDPWAKWRKPEAPAAGAATAAVDTEKKPKTARPQAERPSSKRPTVERPSVKAAARPAEQPPAASAEPPPKPVGTLGVRKSATEAEPDRPARRKPVRGGALPKRPAAAPRAAPHPAPAAGTPAMKAKPAAVPRAEAGGTPPQGVRLSKVMSARGLCSRREADLWIERGWVFVDGERISELGSRIDPDAEISISREASHEQAKHVTILLNKPVGYVSGQPEPGFTPAITLIGAESQVRQSGDPEFKPWMLRNLAPSGRLDIDSTGLLVLTRDGRIAKLLIGEDSDIEKEYLVRVEGTLIPNGLKLLNHGLELDGKPLKPARVKQINEDQLHFILKEGKKRQIRRMCELVGLRVTGLKRVRIGRVKLGDLQPGQWRFLRADESF